MTPRDIEKLKAINCVVERRPEGVAWRPDCPWMLRLQGFEDEVGTVLKDEAEGWLGCKAYAQSPEGMKATMADALQWLRTQGQVALEHDPDEGWYCMVTLGPPKPTDDPFISLHNGVQEFADDPQVATSLALWAVP